ncbi:hypothetical protein LINPERPRIM_LOCUS32666, partial [Linum perenne]
GSRWWTTDSDEKVKKTGVLRRPPPPFIIAKLASFDPVHLELHICPSLLLRLLLFFFNSISPLKIVEFQNKNLPSRPEAPAV